MTNKKDRTSAKVKKKKKRGRKLLVNKLGPLRVILKKLFARVSHCETHSVPNQLHNFFFFLKVEIELPNYLTFAKDLQKIYGA